MVPKIEFMEADAGHKTDMTGLKATEGYIKTYPKPTRHRLQMRFSL